MLKYTKNIFFIFSCNGIVIGDAICGKLALGEQAYDEDFDPTSNNTKIYGIPLYHLVSIHELGSKKVKYGAMKL